MSNPTKKLEDIVNKIYNEMYEKAEPSADYEDLKQKAPLDPPIYKRHYLDQNTQKEIMDKHLEDSDLSGLEHDKVRMTVNLGAAPITSKENRVDK